MPKFIKLTRQDGSSININPDFIMGIQQRRAEVFSGTPGWTEITLPEWDLKVTETAEDILSAISKG